MKRKLNRWVFLISLFCLFFLLTPGISLAQQVIISGVVTDSSDHGVLADVSISIKGVAGGTVSDARGRFTFNVKQGSTLVFSHIGYQPKPFIILAGNSNLNVELLPDARNLDQVVVVGYGTQRRENVIGSVGQVTSKQIENRPVTQLSNALAGQMPGVTVIQRSGQPGANASTINVRGVGSFGAGPGALVIIDGIPGDLNNINVNDVESVSVLKDASSAAIYGARAANGVIIITTKLAKADKLEISYSGYVGVQRPTSFPEFVDSWEYATLINETGTVYTPAEIQKFKDGSDPDNYANTDYIGGVIAKSSMQTNHNISVSNSVGNTKYDLSLGYLYQDGLVAKNDYNRVNLRFNVKTALNKKIDLTTRLSANNSIINEPNGPAKVNGGMLNIIGQAIRYPSRYPARLSDGSYGVGLLQIGTPVSWVESESFYKSKDLDLTANMRLDYKIVKGLKLSGIAAYNRLSGYSKGFQATQVINPNITLNPNTLTVYNSSTDYYTLQALAEYSKRIKAHQFSVLGGYSFESNTFEESSAFRDKLPGNQLTQINVGASDNQQATGTSSEWALQSFFARVNYSFANKYLLEGVVRRDGSSRFPTTKKYSTFPSVAVGWQIGREKFIRDNFTWINELKLKGSIGVLGNQNIPNYPYQNTYSIASGFNYPIGGVLSSGARRTVLVDTTLHWESTRTADVGLDMTLLKSKLNLSATYFNRYSYDILYSPASSVSATLGFGLSQQNVGKLVNSGFEFSAGYNDNIGGFSYSVTGNLTVLDNKVKDLGIGNIYQPNGMVGNGSNLFIGYPMQMYYGFVADGLFVDAGDVSRYADQKSINPTVQPGDIRYKDISGPNGTPDGKVDATYDRAVLGSSIPKYTFGINLGAAYKGFDVTIFLQGVSGVSNYMNNNAALAFYNDGSIQTWQANDHWTADNPRSNAAYPRLERTTGTGSYNSLASSFWLLDGSYLRIKNLQLGYQIPAKLLSKASLKDVRFYLSGENLATFSHFRKGWDAEIGTSGSANDASTIGNTYYPILSIITFGVNVKF